MNDLLRKLGAVEGKDPINTTGCYVDAIRQRIESLQSRATTAANNFKETSYNALKEFFVSLDKAYSDPDNPIWIEQRWKP